MTDVILVTADSVRADYVDAMEFVSSLDGTTGITAAHYTRPSVAALLTANLRSAMTSRAVGPTVAAAFQAAGYTTIGLSSSPHTDATFDFDAGFDRFEHFSEAGNRGRSWRQFFAQFDLLRRAYHRVRPPQAKLSTRLPDADLVDHAIAAFNEAEPPRFCYLHLMGTHRPYGTGDDAVPERIDRKALFSPGRLTDAERETIEDRYRSSLGRADEQIERLLNGLDTDDRIVAFTSDHGDEFGEDGHYFHQPQRRRVSDPLVRVPVATEGVDIGADRISLLDVAPTLAAEAGVATPDAWDGTDCRQGREGPFITIAPWHDRATVRWDDGERRLIARDADVSLVADGTATGVERPEMDDDIEAQLRDLGYVG